MKKLLIFLSIFFCCCTCFAIPFNQIVFFGDSLSDDGNIYRLFLKILPKSPPYFRGRFSNGPLWSEVVGKYYYDKYYINYTNYAYGGATSFLHLPNIRFVSPMTLDLEINNYLFNALLKNKSTTLFSLWIGGNDYLYDLDSDPETITNRVMEKISWAIQNLMNHGGRYFLIMNLPDLGSTPYSRAHHTIQRMQHLTELHNQKLVKLIEDLQQKNPTGKIIFMNVYEMFNEVLRDPDEYNRKHHVNIKYTTEACWQGGILLKEEAMRELITSDLHALKLSQIGDNKRSLLGISNIMDIILNSPPLQQVYMLGKLFDKGYKPCDNASEYLFWDQMYPSEVVHSVLSKIVLERLEQEFKD